LAADPVGLGGTGFDGGTGLTGADPVRGFAADPPGGTPAATPCCCMQFLHLVG